MSASSTATPPSPGRDASGRFAARNRFGPGNPYARQVAEYRRAIHRAVSPDEFQALARRYYDLAMEGDKAAAKLIFPYLAGKPMEPPVEPDLVDAHEWHVWQQNIAQSGELDFVVDSPLKAVLCEFVATLTPLMEQVWKDRLAGMIQPDETAEATTPATPAEADSGSVPETPTAQGKPATKKEVQPAPHADGPKSGATSQSSASTQSNRHQTAKTVRLADYPRQAMEVVARLLVQKILECAAPSANGDNGRRTPAG